MLSEHFSHSYLENRVQARHFESFTELLIMNSREKKTLKKQKDEIIF